MIGKAAFDVLDWLRDDDPLKRKQALARRVHAGAYDRAAGNREGETGGNKSPAVEPAKAKRLGETRAFAENHEVAEMALSALL